jgi:hypothetical protein
MRQSLVARYLLLHACAGVGVGVLVASGLLLTHALHLRQLISASADAAAAAIFILGGITTIAPLVFATAVGLLAGADLDPTCRPLTADHPALQPRAWNRRRHSDQTIRGRSGQAL